MKFSRLIISIFFLFPGYVNASSVEEEFNKINRDLKTATEEIRNAHRKKDKAALLSFKIDQKLDPIQQRLNEFRQKHPEYKPRFKAAIEDLNKLIDQINEQKENDAPTEPHVTSSGGEVYHKDCKSTYSVLHKALDSYNHGDGPSQSELKEIIELASNTSNKYPACKEKILTLQKAILDSLDAKVAEAKETLPADRQGLSDVISYDEWFTMQKTGIKSGKKYTFLACVNGSRDLTAVECHVPGSAAKRIFYRTDDIKDLETKKRWVNTINEVKCVTAYITGGEAFVVSLNNQEKCKN